MVCQAVAFGAHVGKVRFQRVVRDQRIPLTLSNDSLPFEACIFEISRMVEEEGDLRSPLSVFDLPTER